VVCIVPPELAPKLRETLEEHFADDPEVTVVIERRKAERRAKGDRRKKDDGPPKGTEERRKIRNADGRRVGERRAALVPTDAPTELPRKVRRHLETVAMCERIEMPTERLEDLETLRLVTRIQHGERDAFSSLYRTYFDRVYGYLRVALGDTHEAEDGTQQVFMRVLEALPACELRGQAFAAWLFTITRNLAVTRHRATGRVDVIDPTQMTRHQDAEPSNEEIRVLDWINDADVLLLIERLPIAQRQVLAMRYMLGMSSRDTAEVLGTSSNHVSVLQYRALGFLRERLTALGREPRDVGRSRLQRCKSQARVLRRRRFALSP
jgi:RNA polymerase sigma-70 factor (ECF subfamily)